MSPILLVVVLTICSYACIRFIDYMNHVHNHLEHLLTGYYHTWFFSAPMVEQLQNYDRYLDADLLYFHYTVSKNLNDFIRRVRDDLTYKDWSDDLYL